MGAMTGPAVVHEHVRTATPLLSFLAGPFAAQIAHLWPAPHEGFLTLPTARRHAAAIALSRSKEVKGKDVDRFKHFIMFERDARLAELLAADAAPGLIKTLAKLGEVLWAHKDYDRFLQAFSEPNANRVLRHMQTITPSAFEPIAILPAALREAKIIRRLKELNHARVLAQAFDLILLTQGQDAAGAAAHRWTKAKSRDALFEKAADDVYPTQFGQLIPRPILPATFEPIASVSALKSIALEFENCLRDFVDDVARGRMLVYVWRSEPDTAIALTLDAGGWRLAEAEGKKNQPLGEQALRSLVDILLGCGVRTGPALSTIVRRLNVCRNDEGYLEVLKDDFVEALELGDLWS